MVRLLPAILSLHLRGLAVKVLQLLWQAWVGMFYFFGGALSRESDDRLEARRVSKQGSTQSDYQEEEEVQGLGPNSQTTLSA